MGSLSVVVLLASDMMMMRLMVRDDDDDDVETTGGRRSTDMRRVSMSGGPGWRWVEQFKGSMVIKYPT
jgi:hypothetical protein